MKIINNFLYEKSGPVSPNPTKDKFIFTPFVIGMAIKRLIEGDGNVGIDLEQFEHKTKNILLVIGISNLNPRIIYSSIITVDIENVVLIVNYILNV